MQQLADAKESAKQAKFQAREENRQRAHIAAQQERLAMEQARAQKLHQEQQMAV